MEYKNHFLTNVIFRVDFASEEKTLKNELNTEIREACLSNFPIAESIEMQKKEVQVNASPEKEETVVNSEKVTEWHFWGKEREKKLILTSQNMIIDFNKYKSFEEFKHDFFAAYRAVQKVYPTIKINRVGLRYIDQIKLSENSKAKNWKNFWKTYIAAELIGSLQFPDDEKAIARHMSSIEMNYSDCMLRFQYGIFNPDYPAPNKKQEFILDTDVYSVGLFSMEEIEELMDMFHSRADEWFEKSIKQPLRVRMGVCDNNERR